MSSNVNIVWPYTGSDKVQLAGSFNNWQPADMTKVGQTWSLALDLEPGKYEFKYVVDGKWVHDENAPNKANEMGSCNNTLTVDERSESPAQMSTSSDDGTWEIVERSHLSQSKLDNSKTPKLEVERKFIVPSNYNERLIANGFKLVMEFDEVLIDKYYDTPDHRLLAQDFWLRQRNGDWELKYPIGQPVTKLTEATMYHETSSHEDILSKLNPVLEKNESSFSDLVAGLGSFADLETRRKCYNKDDVNVVIDMTDWGYKVGEIEVMVTDEREVAEATRKIELLAIQLDFAHMDLNALFKTAYNPSTTC